MDVDLRHDIRAFAALPVMLTSDTERQPSRNKRHPIATGCVVRRSMLVEMKTDMENIKLKVQATLDELNKEYGSGDENRNGNHQGKSPGNT